MHQSYTDLTPGDYDAPVFSLGGQDDYAFSPDGQEICYTSNHDKNPAASTNNDLWIVPVRGRWASRADRAGDNGTENSSSGGPAKNITADQSSQIATRRPLYSPDGRYMRLPCARASASGIRERPLPTDAVRPQDGGEEESGLEKLDLLGSERFYGRPIPSESCIRAYEVWGEEWPVVGHGRDRSTL